MKIRLAIVHIAAMGMLALCVLAAPGRASAQDAAAEDRPHLRHALMTARWLESVQIETEHGLAWPVDPETPAVVLHHLYSGTCGVILFHLELHRATGDAKHLDIARRGADELIANLPDSLEKTDAGLYTGVAGYGYTLEEVFKSTREPRHRDAALRCLNLIKDAAVTLQGGAEWSDVTDIVSGSAGIGLYLLYAHEAYDDAASLVLAQQAGDRLIELGEAIEIEPGPDGLRWRMTPEYERLMPNFSHGTAGVAYFLATLHERLVAVGSITAGDSPYLTAARAGLNRLASISNWQNEEFKIHHHEPGGEDLYYLGWCHGPTGTARLLHRFDQLDPGEGFDDGLRLAAQSILKSGIPEQRTPGFWENVGVCCGSAGVGQFFLDAHETIGEDTAKEFVTRINDDILRRATRVEFDDGTVGLKWIQAEHRVQPDLLIAQTGLMQGAAGIGLWFLQLDAQETGREFATRLPDSPYEQINK